MAQDRSLVDQAFAGDIVGIHDPGNFKIGDGITEGETLNFRGIPLFAPEFFSRVQLKDPLKSKQLNKALDQLSEEGAVQVFRPVVSNEQWLGVVGVLQFDVVQYRILNEYNVDMTFVRLGHEGARWLGGEEEIVDKFVKDNQAKICKDQHGNPAVVFDAKWRIGFWQERYPGLEFYRSNAFLA
jgi:peptide chain release factor 3